MNPMQASPNRPIVTLRQLLDLPRDSRPVYPERRSVRNAQRLLLAAMGVDLDSLREGVAHTTIVDSDRDVVLEIPAVTL
jgi:hypothetical protein